VDAVMNLHIQYNAGKLSSGFTAGGCSSGTQLHIVSWLFNPLINFPKPEQILCYCLKLKLKCY
jgi:hypothetical protein